MRIFFLPTSYPDEENRQRDIFIYEQAKELANRGHEVVVLHIKKMPSKKLFSKVSYKIQTVDDVFAKRYIILQKTFCESRLHLANRNGFVQKADMLYRYACSIHGKPDVIYAHFSIWAGYAAIKIKEKYHVPVVTIEHFSGLMEPQISQTIKKGLMRCVEESDVFLCVSEGLRKAIIKHVNPDKNLLVVSNMIDRSFQFRPKTDHSSFTISSIGNINKRKDFLTLICAFIMAFTQDDNVVLRIGGTGPEKEKLESLVRENHREKQICFLGMLSREETVREYVNCDAFALASQFETFGLVYREALATGRPIITTNHGGFSKDNWHEEYGYMTHVKNVQEFADALRKIRAEIDSFDNKHISELCLNDCSADSIGTRIENILWTATQAVSKKGGKE